MDKGSLWEKVTRAVDLPEEPMPGKTLIEIVDNQSVLVENHSGVMSYCPEQISIKTKKGCIFISGSGMCLSKMTREQLRIRGTICGVELRGRR